jgi:phosphomannomutase/phosphoglucomutase
MHTQILTLAGINLSVGIRRFYLCPVNPIAMAHARAEDRIPRLFGTNGVRGVVNSPDMDSGFAMRLGFAIATFLDGPVMIGTDARTSCDMLKSACSSGLMAGGCDVIDLGVLPTPALQYAVKRNKVAGGVMITASHNPPEFNGIKCIEPDGTEMSRANEEAVERIYHLGDFHRADWTRIGALRRYPSAIDEYVAGVVSRVDAPGIRKAKLRVAVDCGNGPAGLVAPKMLRRMGVSYVSVNANLDGAFPAHDSEPTPENTRDFVEFVRDGGFDLGVVHDGDADRSIFVDGNGRYLHGDRTLALVAYHMCREQKGALVVTNVASSMCVEDAVRMGGGRLMLTRVGSPVIARAMIEHGGVFGGEENGGLIFADFQYCRDGAMALAKVLEIVARNGSLAKLVDMIPSYCQYKTKTSCPEQKKESVLATLAESAKGARVDLTDGVKIFVEGGWVIIRPSGTEPIFRIFSEARVDSEAKELAESYKKKVCALVSA